MRDESLKDAVALPYDQADQVRSEIEAIARDATRLAGAGEVRIASTPYRPGWTTIALELVDAPVAERVGHGLV